MSFFRSSILVISRRNQFISLTHSTSFTAPRFQLRNMATDSKPAHYILSFYVPRTDTDKVMSQVCANSGAGSYPGGLYTEAYWITAGTGQFRPMKGANPTIGTVGEVEKVEEDKVEVLCIGKECATKAVEELKKVHPYEEVPYYVIKSEEF